MADDKVSVEISIEERAALKALTQLSRGLDNFEKQAVASVKKTDGAFASFKGNLAAIGASKALGLLANGLSSLTSGALDAAGTYEQLQRRLEVLTGSADTAASVFKDLTDFAAKTPFQITEITEATSQLLAFGFSTDEALEKIKILGDISAGSGKALGELTTIFGQVSGQSKLTAERLNQLEEAAIPISQALADVLQKPKEQIRDLVSQGVIDFATFEKAFQSLTNEGGLFSGSLEKQSATLNGSLSNLEDSFTNLQAALGEVVSPIVIEGAAKLAGVFESMVPTIKDVAKTTGSLVEWFKAEDGIPSAKAEIKALEATLNDVKNTTDRVNSVFGEDSWFGKINRSRANERIKNIRAEIDELTKSLKTQGIDVKAEREAEMQSYQADYEKYVQTQNAKAKAAADGNLKIIEERRKLQAELDLIEQERKIKDTENKLADTELLSTEREALLTELQGYEDRKAEIQYNTQLESNKRIFDEDTRKLANKRAFAQKELMIEQNKIKQQQALDQQNLRDRAAFFSAATSLQNSKSKELAAIGKAAGIAQIIQATPPAIASSFNYGTTVGGPPVGFAFAAIAAAAQAEQLKRMMSFANGGVVGGFSGATGGGDNRVANVRTGEMYLNAQQQRQLFEVANGNVQSEDNRVLEITSIVQVDEREIARAVRNQRLEGFI